jgi:mono/diheme cytochrome c family protein
VRLVPLVGAVPVPVALALAAAGCSTGGVGPELAGVVAEKYPNIEDQIAVVTNGKGEMPAWRDDLTAKEIHKVVEYTRTGLGQ